MSPAGQGNDATQVYAAEDNMVKVYRNSLEYGLTGTFRGRSLRFPKMKRFRNAEEAQDFVDMILWDPRIAALFPGFSNSVTVIQTALPKLHAAVYSDGVIALSTVRTTDSMRDITVLHELAHHLSKAHELSDGHGVEFRRAYLSLIRMFISEDLAYVLAHLYRDQKLSI